MKERFRWLAAAIAAHPDRKVVGRTRLQKEIKLLQRLKFPTEYSYTLHFFGPYSEGLHAEIGLLESLGLVEEEPQTSQEGVPYYILRAKPDAVLAEIKPYQGFIDTMDAADAVVLELAATYDMFRGMGSDHKEALQRLRRKKGSKCEGGNEAAALQLLQTLGLPIR
ncbi:MAG: hypothetical protein ACLQNE_14440 [Thermoguttaceae bacterium]